MIGGGRRVHVSGGLLLPFLLAGPLLMAGGESCSRLVVGSRLAGERIPCFVADVAEGEFARISAEQPVDLVLRITSADRATEVDSFEFGPETVTLAAGSYRIEIRPAATPEGPLPTFTVSMTAAAIPSAPAWSEAERAATAAKRSGDPHQLLLCAERWRQLDDRLSTARTFLGLGDSALGRSDPEGARRYYEQALTLCTELNHRRCMAEAANNSGYSASLAGDLRQAAMRLADAASHWQVLGMREFAARTWNNLGLMFWQASDFGRALEWFGKARKEARGRYPFVHAQVLNNIGLCYQSLADNERAIAYFQSAIRSFDEQKRMPHLARAELNLGRSRMMLGHLDAAGAAQQRALRRATALDDLAVRGDILNNLGQLAVRRGNAAQATELLTEALAAHRKVQARRAEASALHFLGMAAQLRGDAGAARESLERAAAIRADSGLRDDAAESSYELAKVEFRFGDQASARQRINSAIAMIETLRGVVPAPSLRASYYARKRRFFDLSIEIAGTEREPGAAAESLMISERAHGRSLLDLLRERNGALPIPRALLERRIALDQQISLAARQLTAPASGRSGGLQQRVQLLLSAADQVEAEIRATPAGRALGTPLESITALQALLPDDTALLEYYLGERSSYLWIARRDSVRRYALGPGAAIERLATEAGAAFGSRLERRRSPEREANFQRCLRKLAALLVPEAGRLRGVRRLIIVPDGSLNRVPFEALQPPNQPEPLGLRFAMARIPSAGCWRAVQPPPRPGSFRRDVLVLADPVFSPDDARLGARARPNDGVAAPARIPFNTETAMLRSLLPADRMAVYQGLEASRQSLFSAPTRSFRVIHFSTHAYIDDRIPELSRVLLSTVDQQGRPVEGPVYAREFARLRLEGSIVVISSCQSALGRVVPGEGLAGFTSSLFAAGASQLVLSLAEVDAEGSAEFFSEVYRRLFAVRPETLDGAMLGARRALAASPRWSDPFYWAAFTAMGRFDTVR